MGAIPASDELEPLTSAPLRRRFPHLGVAMDSGQMQALLQMQLLDGTGFVTEGCALPKADVTGGVCRLQYPLQVRTPAGDIQEILVLGTMFTDPRAAHRFERAALAPLAAPRSSRAQLPAVKSTGVLEALGMAVSVFPVSDLLPTLVDVTDRRLMDGVLRSVLATGDGAELAAIELVRHRRTPRCVLRYRFGPGGHEAVYGKVGSTAGSDHVRRGLDTLASRVLRTSNGSVLVPSMLAHRPELDLALFRSVPGSRADLAVAAEREAMLSGAARAAASMHTSGVDVGMVRTLDGELVRARQAVQLIEDDAPALAGWLTGIADGLASMIGRAPAPSPTFAHGDFTLSQLLIAGSQVGVLDFDGLCQAEPELDLGRFVCYLRVALAKSGNPAADELTRRFLATYHAFGGAPISATRVRINSIASLILMAVRSWQLLKPRRLQLVCGVLDREARQ